MNWDLEYMYTDVSLLLLCLLMNRSVRLYRNETLAIWSSWIRCSMDPRSWHTLV